MGESVANYEIPKECIGGVVVNEGSDFYVEASFARSSKGIPIEADSYEI